MIGFWFITVVMIIIAGSIGQYLWNQAHPGVLDLSDALADLSDEDEPWEGY